MTDNRVKFTRSDQRDIVYAAEDALRRILDMAFLSDQPVEYSAYGSVFTIPLELKFADIPSIQTYCDGVLSLDWVREQWPERASVPLTVSGKKRGDMSRASHEMRQGVGYMLIPPHRDGGRESWAMREELIIHELAHHLSTGEHGNDFISKMVGLIENLLGAQVSLLFNIELSKAREALTAQMIKASGEKGK